ncbi:N-acetylneuraminate synthase family protein [Candidatus Pelagibacter sp.]|nr:N-acetylneuraminate synthase family protein [Candidatus Pelagibacter sp.]
MIKFHKPLIIAEIGLSHNGNIKKALDLIYLSKKSGADIVKFQTHFAKFESTLDEPFRIKASNKFKNRYDYWKKTEFTQKQWKKIIKFCKKTKIIFATSPFSVEAVKIMRNLGCKNWKIGSGEVFSNWIINEILRRKEDGLIISSGMSTWTDLKKNYKLIRKKKNKNFVMLQCTSEYPSSLKKVGLNVITDMKKKFSCYVGLSDHTGSIFPSIVALSQGADLIEVHVCISKKSKGLDINASVTFDELKIINKARDAIFEMKENPVNKNILSNVQKKYKKIFGKSLALKNDLMKGDKIDISNLTIKKPGTGLKEKLLKNIANKTARKNLSSKRILRKGDFE